MSDSEMNKQKDEADDNAHAADDDVRDSKERIFATKPRRCRQNHSFCATELGNWVRCKHRP